MIQDKHGSHGRGAKTRRLCSAACIAVALVAVSAACGSGVAAYTIEGQSTAVSHYKTFGIVIPDPEDLKANQMHVETMQRLAALSEERMKNLGYEPVAAKDADLLIGLSPEARLYGPLEVINESSKADNTLDEHFDADGTLNVTFADTRAKQVVLKRVAKARVNVRLGDKQMKEIVANVFDGLPRAQ